MLSLSSQVEGQPGHHPTGLMFVLLRRDSMTEGLRVGDSERDMPAGQTSNESFALSLGEAQQWLRFGSIELVCCLHGSFDII